MKNDLIPGRCQHLAACAIAAGIFSIEAVQPQQPQQPQQASPVVTLERALFLETIKGDPEAASRLYVSVFSDERTGARTRAESALLAAECFDLLDELLLAKFHYEFLVHDDKRFDHLSTRADAGLFALTTYLMEDSGTVAAKDFQWIGDLFIGLEGALKLGNQPAASSLMEELATALRKLQDDHEGAQDQGFIDNTLALVADLKRAIDKGATADALNTLGLDRNIRVFRQRMHFAESDEVFSQGLVSFDKIAEAMHQQHAERTIFRCDNLLSYLEPLRELTESSRRERELAQRFIDAVALIRESARNGSWDEAWRAWLGFRRDCSDNEPVHFHLGEFLGKQLADFSFYPQFALVADRFLFAENAAKSGNSDAVKEALEHNHGLLERMQSRADRTSDEAAITVYQDIVAAMTAAHEEGGLEAVLPLLEEENIVTDKHLEE